MSGFTEFKEIKNYLERETGAGPSVLFRNGKNWMDSSEGNTAVIGQPGVGKTRGVVIPQVVNCINGEENVIVTDTKGEIIKATAGYANEMGYDIHVLNFRNVYHSEGFNPLHLIRRLCSSDNLYDRQKGEEMIAELADDLFPTEQSKDPFWQDSAKFLFIGIVTAMLEISVPPEQFNLATVFRMVQDGNERYGATKLLKAFLEILPEDSAAKSLISDYVNTANDTAAGIKSTFIRGLSDWYQNSGLLRLISNNGDHELDIDQLLLQEKRFILYFLIPDETSLYEKVAGIIVSQVLEDAFRIAYSEYDGSFPTRINLILEEIGNVCKSIPQLDHLMNTCRARNIRISLVLQDLKQLNAAFGEPKALAILSSISLFIVFRTSSMETLKVFSERLGTRNLYLPDGRTIEGPLVSPSNLGGMKKRQALVLIDGRIKYITFFPDYSTYFNPDQYPEYVCQEHIRNLPKIFNIQRYVKKAKNRQALGFSVEKEKNDPIPLVDIDIDAMMRDIDLKIAELDAEEASGESSQEKLKSNLHKKSGTRSHNNRSTKKDSADKKPDT